MNFGELRDMCKALEKREEVRIRNISMEVPKEVQVIKPRVQYSHCYLPKKEHSAFEHLIGYEYHVTLRSWADMITCHMDSSATTSWRPTPDSTNDELLQFITESLESVKNIEVKFKEFCDDYIHALSVMSGRINSPIN